MSFTIVAFRNSNYPKKRDELTLDVDKIIAKEQAEVIHSVDSIRVIKLDS